MIDIDYIREQAERKLDKSGLFLVDIRLKPGNRIYVYLDGDHDVTIEDCTELSRFLNSILPTDEDHELTVSSCGADQPLKQPRQYVKNIGRNLIVKLPDQQQITGTLVAVSPEGITLKPEPSKKKKAGDTGSAEPRDVPFKIIKEAKVKISFNKK